MSKFWKFNHKGLSISKPAISMLLAAILQVSALAPSSNAQAHCDSVQGPVVQAAKQALDSGNMKLILPYIQVDDEAELTAAFKHTRDVRKISPEAKKLADQYFFELAVRLHRQGEGAPYTGLSNEPVPAAIQAADKAMQTGELEEVHALLNDAFAHGLDEKYQAVVAARTEAKKLGTIEAERERAEAELVFEKYVYELYSLAASGAVHTEGGPPAGSGHNH